MNFTLKHGLIVAILSFQFSAFSQQLEFKEEKEGVLLLENDQPRYFYQSETKSKNGQYPRANYIHPLYGLQGEVLTEDFPEDHLHHRGIFWSWHQLYAEGKRIGDPWLSDGISWEVQNIYTEVKDNIALLHGEIFWTNTATEKAILKENLIIAYKRINAKVYSLTFDIHLTALTNGIAIGGSEDEKGYGGFSPRIKLPDDVRFISDTGEVEPHNLPVSAGPWINLTGSFDPASKTISGVTIMGEPEKIPNYQGWILRRANSMQNMAFPGRSPVSIKNGESLSFRNQILVHQNVGTQAIQEYYRDFLEQ